MKKIILPVILLALIMPQVLGAVNLDFGSVIQNIGQHIYTLMQNTYTVYAATMILFFVLLYGVFAAGLSKVKVFQGDKGLGKNGKMVAVSLALLSDIGIFYGIRSAETAIERVAGSIGFGGGVAFAFLIFAITYYNLKTSDAFSRAAAWVAGGLALLVWGMFADNQAAVSWGSFILIVAIIAAAIWSITRGRTATRDDAGDRDRRDNAELRPPVPPRAPQHAPQQVQNFQGVMRP